MRKWLFGLSISVFGVVVILWWCLPSPVLQATPDKDVFFDGGATRAKKGGATGSQGGEPAQTVEVLRPDLTHWSGDSIVLDQGPQRARESDTQFMWRMEFAQAFEWFCLATDMDVVRRQRLLRTLAETQQAYEHIAAQEPDILAPSEQRAAFLEWQTVASVQLVEALEKELGTFLTFAEISQWHYWMHTNVVVKMPYTYPVLIPDGALDALDL